LLLIFFCFWQFVALYFRAACADRCETFKRSEECAPSNVGPKIGVLPANQFWGQLTKGKNPRAPTPIAEKFCQMMGNRWSFINAVVKMWVPRKKKLGNANIRK